MTFDIDACQYRVDTEPDHRAIGAVVDAEIKRYFMGRTVVVRGIGSQDHPGRTVDELVEIIRWSGTDRYDPTRKGLGYENLENKHIDLFAIRRKVTPRMRLFKDLSWGFYHGRSPFTASRPASTSSRSTTPRNSGRYSTSTKVGLTGSGTGSCSGTPSVGRRQCSA